MRRYPASRQAIEIGSSAQDAALGDRDDARRACAAATAFEHATGSTASVRRLRLLTPMIVRAGIDARGRASSGIVHLDQRRQPEVRARR